MKNPEIPHVGSFIGQKYQVKGVCGQGGFAVVYLVYSHETKRVYALKTLVHELFKDVERKGWFRKEINTLMDLKHPYIVRAYSVDEIDGRLYIAMEYVEPNEQGLNSLEGYLQRRPPDLAQSLRWAIQFCYGMEYAYSKGVRCHRNINPAHIMISTNKTVKIIGFNLAGIKLRFQHGSVGLSTGERSLGTSAYMPPEQFTNAAECDERSDIYAFGIVLFQMVSGSKIPFLAPLPRDNSEEEIRRFWKQMYELHSEAPVPRLDSPLFPIIQRCLEKESSKRYQTLRELRADLEPLLKRLTGETIKPPELKEFERCKLSSKGVSLKSLGRADEAIRCDFIGQKYEIYEELGHGGFGIVYLVYSHETESILALKTFKDEYLEDAETRKLFRREASVWVDLDRHPYLVRAYFVDEVEGRLYVAMEYIAPNEDGLNSLQRYLDHQPPDLAQSLRWAIQFCHGMEYAYSKGVRCHRDIKPDNIMISTNKTVKISDFGLAGVLGASSTVSGARLNVHQGKVGFSVMEGRGWGTPTYMPPEQFINAASCDPRSDIYAFGVVLYQMAAGGRLPFLAAKPRDDSEEEQRRFWKDMWMLHCQSPVPRLDSPLFPIVLRCLEKEPGRRYQTFKEVLTDLEPLLKRQTGETVRLPKPPAPKAWEWINKGISFYNLGRFDEAIKCYDKSIEANPQHANAWFNKAQAEDELDRRMDAARSYRKFLELAPAQYAKQIEHARQRLQNLQGR